MALVKHFKELRVYRQAFTAAPCIYELLKRWPKEERYALTDQIRRSSRSVSANIAEAWRKRRYPTPTPPHAHTPRPPHADAEE